MSQNWYGQGFYGGKYDVGIKMGKNGKNPNITLNNQNIIFLVKKWCVFHENGHFKGFGSEKYDSGVKILKKLNFGHLLRHNHQGKPQKYQKYTY